MVRPFLRPAQNGGRIYIVGIVVWSLVLTLGSAPNTIFAQVDDIDELVRGGPNDARLLIDSYLAPGITGFESGLNTGWGGSVEPHQQFGFYLHAVVSLTRIPEDDQAFSIDPTELERFTLESPIPERSPTVGGSENAPRYRLRSPSGEVVTMPEGAGFSYVPIPLVEAGVGVGRRTDIMIRVVPPTTIEDYGELILYGIGAKHGLNQWIPGGRGLPVELSALFQYTRFNLDAILDDDDNQDLDWDTNTWTLNLVAGKRTSVFSFYGGLGLETSSSTVSLLGPYEVEDETGDSEIVEDPVDVDFGHDATLRGFAGIGLRLSPATLFVEGTIANYSSLTIGVGVNIR
mgnify:CR=1 FL=1